MILTLNYRFKTMHKNIAWPDTGVDIKSFNNLLTYFTKIQHIPKGKYSILEPKIKGKIEDHFNMLIKNQYKKKHKTYHLFSSKEKTDFLNKKANSIIKIKEINDWLISSGITFDPHSYVVGKLVEKFN